MQGLRALLAGGWLLLAAFPVQASLVSGGLWHVPEALIGFSGTGAIPANVPARPADVAFDVGGLLNFSGTNATVGDWLASGGAINLIENVAGTLASRMDDGTNGSILRFVGLVSVTNGQTFTVEHDDGLTLIIGGLTVVDEPGPTSPVTTTRVYTGPTGIWAFELIYSECCQGPAVLDISLPLTDNVPEPATLMLVGVALVGLAFVWRKRRKR